MYEGEQHKIEESEVQKMEQLEDDFEILDAILIEELAIDGICGVY